MLDTILNALSDSVYSVRNQACTSVIPFLLNKYGIDWFKTSILPFIKSVSKSKKYHYRLSAIYTVSSVLELCLEHKANNLIEKELLPIIIEFCQDPIPNVRFNVAKVMPDIVKVLNKAKTEKGENDMDVESNFDILKVKINSMKDDADPDVKYFALKCISASD